MPPFFSPSLSPLHHTCLGINIPSKPGSSSCRDASSNTTPLDSFTPRTESPESVKALTFVVNKILSPSSKTPPFAIIISFLLRLCKLKVQTAWSLIKWRGIQLRWGPRIIERKRKMCHNSCQVFRPKKSRQSRRGAELGEKWRRRDNHFDVNLSTLLRLPLSPRVGGWLYDVCLCKC